MIMTFPLALFDSKYLCAKEISSNVNIFEMHGLILCLSRKSNISLTVSLLTFVLSNEVKYDSEIISTNGSKSSIIQPPRHPVIQTIPPCFTDFSDDFRVGLPINSKTLSTPSETIFSDFYQNFHLQQLLHLHLFPSKTAL